MIKTHEVFDDRLTSLLQKGNYEIQSWITAKSHIFLVQMSQLMSNFSGVEQGNPSRHLIIYCGVTR